MGIEPTYAAWEAAVLPLNYTRARRCLYRADGRFGKLPRSRRATSARQIRFTPMTVQVALTRERLLWQARRLEQQASLAKTEEEQDRLLNQTVALRLLANLPRYNPDLH